ncbi:P63C domain-containing protein [Maritimibacter alkaliphilus HTCC2654]|uniref:Phage-related protein n=1 Tax=Maritimibacter alkaliphilus HTCC2654 TaxID=314271 RepID=A3VET9_9RHOB|nr:P63C domain-containing protein [Maritimibacter alkaliphilus]EAQ13427.1 phage-related protein [Rhodobacterales bacterium HTCC2654] [Maritimibacter alkaliphilus HTCC2654]TYP85154.1 P63C domain-containing protein [Maritimibacter alkaliphilus HTCC2654]
MPDEKKDIIEPIDANFEEVVSKVAPRLKASSGPEIIPASERDALADNEATHRGKLRIGPVEIPCAVLKDGRRVLSGHGIASVLGGRSGAAKRLKTEAEKDGAHMPVFLASKSLLPYISKELMDGPLKPITYKSGDTEAEGYPAEALPEICNIWLQARQDGVLNPQQADRAQAAEIVMRGLADLGIIGLVDEATGYQNTRDHDALQAILDKYLQKEFAAWAKRFPDAFYREIFRLRGWSWNAMSVARPGVVGKYTNDIVYERLAPGILEELQAMNPTKDDGGRLRRHHQFLTEDIGHPALAQHLHAVIGLMRASATWEQFKTMLDRAFPKKGTQLELLLDDDR